MTAGDEAPERTTLALGLFASFLSMMLAAAMLVLRTGLPTPLGAVAVGPAILSLATLGPALWANRSGGFRRQLWLGPLAALMLLIGCLIAALGLAGAIVLWAAAAGLVIRACMVLHRTSRTSGANLLAWAALLLVACLLAIVLAAGSKYLNFVADQLLLYGRTDGDVMFHGAIANAYRHFGFPSTGINGVHLLHYHTGVDALAALIAGGVGIDAVLALIILQSLILIPLAVFGIGWGATVFGPLLPSDSTLRALRVAIAAVIVGLLMQSGWLGNLSFFNPPMLTSGVLFILLAPAVVLDLIERRVEARLALVVAVLALPVLSITKISTGLIWAALTGYLVLRMIGPKRVVFWVTGLVMLALFAGCFWLTSDPHQSGVVLFGTPFYVDNSENLAELLLLSFTIHLYPLIAVIGLAGLRSAAPASGRRLLIEALLVVAVAANLPGLVLEIPGGDAFFFLSAMNWLAAPLVVMIIAALPGGLRTGAAWNRRIVLGLIGGLVLEALINGGLRTETRAYTAISGAALLHTGDLSYYTDDKRRIWKADTQRALAEHGLVGLYRLPPPVPYAAGLEAVLEAARHDAQIAAYIPPQADYWNLVKDCDGRSLWPMAAAGVPLIDGYVPDQAACVQTFALSGSPPPPAQRTDLVDADLCARAKPLGFTEVLRIEAVADRSKDRRIDCR